MFSDAKKKRKYKHAVLYSVECRFFCGSCDGELTVTMQIIKVKIMAFMRKTHAREFCANILSPLSSSFAVLRFRPFNLKEKYFFLGEMNTLK